MKASCACGASVFAKGLCRRCYQNAWNSRNRVKRAGYMAVYQKQYQMPDALDTFCSAFHCSPRQLARIILMMPGGGRPHEEVA